MNRRMRIALLTLVAGSVAVAALLGGSARAKDTAAAVRYSHTQHDKLKVNHGVCGLCHVLDDKYTVLAATLGKNHQPCNDPSCHASDFMSREPKICGVCHDGTDPNVKQPALVRRRSSSEFGGDMSHKSHLKKVTARDSGKNAVCKACHGDMFKGTPPPSGGHATCASCHGKSASPSMGSCGGCHKLGETKAASSPTATEWAVTEMFTHQIHGNDPRSSRTETDCTDCHAGIPNATKVADIKNPPMKACDGCHDGKYAFKTTGFECYRCHAVEGGARK